MEFLVLFSLMKLTYEVALWSATTIDAYTKTTKTTKYGPGELTTGHGIKIWEITFNLLRIKIPGSTWVIKQKCVKRMNSVSIKNKYIKINEKDHVQISYFKSL